MRKLIVFNHISLDGYFVDANGGMSWAKTDPGDAEWKAFVAKNTQGNGPLLFGRVTYDLMASYWPTSMADQHDPVVAERMNSAPKVVFSRTMQKASWQNTKLMAGDLATQVRNLKNEAGEGIAILGSGSIVAQLAQAELIDEYQVIVDPIILGKGRTMFEGVEEQIKLKLTKSHTFSNGNIFLCYEPAA